MQTFLPYPDFNQSASVLDRQRLGKQRVEVLQILRALTDPEYGWQHHPAVEMWRGYQQCLVDYGLAVCDEWIKRGYEDSCADKIDLFWDWEATEYPVPPWLGDEDFHASHRSNLYHKNPTHYGPIFGEQPVLAYVWPSNEGSNA